MKDNVATPTEVGTARSAAEVARRMNVTTVTVARWARDGVIECEKLPGRTGAYVFRDAAIEKLARSRRAAKAGQ